MFSKGKITLLERKFWKLDPFSFEDKRSYMVVVFLVLPFGAFCADFHYLVLTEEHFYDRSVHL